MELYKHYLTENDCYKANRKIKPRGVMVHSVGVAQPNASVFLKRWNKPNVKKCVHAFIDQSGVYQTLPWDHRGWHAGDDANNTHIGFEICEPAGHTYNGGQMVGYDAKKNEQFFSRVYGMAVELTAMLCKQYDLDPLADGVVICHSEGYERGIASNHSDVMQWFPYHGKDMDIFRKDVAAKLRQPVRYDHIDEIPIWYRASVEKLTASGVLQGNGVSLDLSEDMCRVFTVMDRLGLIERK